MNREGNTIYTCLFETRPVDLITFMNVAKDVIFRPHSLLDGLQELHTASTTPTLTQVPMADRGTMGHQYVHRTGDEVPLVLTGAATFQVEGPTTKLRLPVHNTAPQ